MVFGDPDATKLLPLTRRLLIHALTLTTFRRDPRRIESLRYSWTWRVRAKEIQLLCFSMAYYCSEPLNNASARDIAP